VSLALGLLNVLALGLDGGSAGANDSKVNDLGDERSDNEERLNTLLDLPPVGSLEGRLEQARVEVEVRRKQRTGQDRRGREVERLRVTLELREVCTVKRLER
jgi:hypothetical protein